MISNTPHIPIRLSSSHSKCSCLFIGERRPAPGRPGRPGLISRRGVFQNGTIQLSFIWFVFVKERTPFRQFFFAHLPCLVWCLCKAVLDTLPLRFWVNRQINYLAFRSYLLGDPSQGRPFVFAPKSEIQDDVGTKLKSTQSYPDQTTFQDISCCRIISSKQRFHPLIRGKPQGRGFDF